MDASLESTALSYGEFLLDEGRLRRLVLRLDVRTRMSGTDVANGQLYVIELVDGNPPSTQKARKAPSPSPKR